jgi:hypothetical protein
MTKMMRALLGLAVVALVAVGAPVTAQAAAVHGLQNGGGGILYTAAPGEDNHVTIYEEAGFIHFIETGASLTPGSYCEAYGGHVRCLRSGTIHVALADGDNWANNSASRGT